MYKGMVSLGCRPMCGALEERRAAIWVKSFAFV